MPTTDFEPQKPKLAYLPVKQIAIYNASQCPIAHANKSLFIRTSMCFENSEATLQIFALLASTSN